MAKGFKNRASSLSPKMRNTNDLAMDSLADRINASANGIVTMSGRGHGRTTPHGRGPKRDGPRTTKRDMLYFVRDYVRELRANNPLLEENWQNAIGWVDGRDIADFLVNEVQYFDCSEIWEYVWLNLEEMYPTGEDAPPSPDCILPAKAVGLYLDYWGKYLEKPNENQNMYLCIPTTEAEEHEEFRSRHFRVFSLDHPYEQPSHGKPPQQIPMPLGEISVVQGIELFDVYDISQYKGNSKAPQDWLDAQQANSAAHLRIVAALLQTINQPRFVVSGKRDVSLVKRQSFKKAAGRFIPDSWNMVTWNVDKPVKAKDHEEGNGARLPLHFRRGHWRVGEKGWKNTRWSETRNRWEQYIHGYEAGHPAFGVKKSYHLPRKE
jgi:hypothetical protein